MSSRYYGKGSSRSTRDDSRGREERPSRDREERPSRDHEERHNRDRERERSRSPRRHSPSRDRRRSQEKSRYHTTDSDHDNFSDSSTDEVPAPPPPPRITKISMGFTKPQAPIKMSLGNTSKASIVPKPTLASVFNADDDEDEPEEMPAEARMRMRNIGRETPTSAGPNSFGKTKQGFCDAKKVFEKNLKEALDTADSKSGTSKLPQTIYRIKGP